jgi:hypothetical protein
MSGSQAIRIVRAPSGEAPLWVREAWIGVTLPTRARGRWTGFGVLTGPGSLLGQLWARLRGRAQRIDGFSVDAWQAVERLAAHNPEAAAWWRREAAAFVRPGSVFVFDHGACEPVVR